MTVESEPAPAARKVRKPLVAVAAIAALGALAAVYGVLGLWRNPGDAACRPAADLARRLAPLAHGEVAAVQTAGEGIRVPTVHFRDSGGAEKSLADWRGRTVLLNLWATWCVPCRKEMPALDALQERLGAPGFEVVAVNIDTRDPEKPKTWLRDVGIRNLAYYSDTNATIFQELKTAGKAFGMPTTLIVDPNGCEIASLAGPAEWASPDGLAFVGAALAR